MPSAPGDTPFPSRSQPAGVGLRVSESSGKAPRRPIHTSSLPTLASFALTPAGPNPMLLRLSFGGTISTFLPPSAPLVADPLPHHTGPWPPRLLGLPRSSGPTAQPGTLGLTGVSEGRSLSITRRLVCGLCLWVPEKPVTDRHVILLLLLPSNFSRLLELKPCHLKTYILSQLKKIKEGKSKPCYPEDKARHLFPSASFIRSF